jgi:hypothetical protein
MPFIRAEEADGRLLARLLRSHTKRPLSQQQL